MLWKNHSMKFSSSNKKSRPLVFKEAHTSLAFGHSRRMCSLSSKIAPHSPQLGLVVMCLQARLALVSTLSCSSSHVKILTRCWTLKCHTRLHIGGRVMFYSFRIIVGADLMKNFLRWGLHPNEVVSHPFLDQVKRSNGLEGICR